jgi:hypothetical protein
MTAKICICTPVYGRPDAAEIAWGYHNAVCGLLRSPDVSFLDGRMFVNVDLVRARSRAVRMFLDQPNATHLLFWDSDVVPRDVNVIHAMINSGKDVIALPYPRKQIHWDRVEAGVRDEAEQAEHGRQGADELEGSGLDWPLRALDKTLEAGMVRAAECGIGFTMIRREALQKMVDHYAAELTFVDQADGQKRATVALFQLLITGGELLSEDYSFFRRWTDIGGEIFVIGDPARHIGNYAFGQTLKP